MEQYYAVYLNDYSTPGFCSVIKEYFGTVRDIRNFVKALDKNGSFEATCKAFGRFEKGVPGAKHTVAYVQHRLLEPVEVLAKDTVSIGEKEWTFSNTYGFPYEMRFDSAFFTRVIIRLKNHYYQCIKGSVTNLAYRDGTHEFSTWTALENSFWGHPESLYSRRAGTDIITKNRLYVIEHRYDTRESALSDFKERTELCLDGICEDVFGDG